MTNYDILFTHFKDGQRIELIHAFQPLLDTWAKDVLKKTKLNRQELPDVISTGDVILRQQIDRRLHNPQILSGKHLAYSLRKPIRKAMREQCQFFLGIPVPSAATLLKRKKAGKPKFKPGETDKRTTLPSDKAIEGKRSQAEQSPSLRQLYAPDPYQSDRYWKLVYWVEDLAKAQANDKCKGIVERMVQPVGEGEKSPSSSEVARSISMPRSTMRDQLDRLRLEIAKSAPPELVELLEEFFSESDPCSAKKENRGHRNKGQVECATANVVPVVADGLTIASRDIWTQPTPRDVDSAATSA